MNDLLHEIHRKFMGAAMDHIEQIVSSGLPPEEKLRTMIVSLVVESDRSHPRWKISPTNLLNLTQREGICWSRGYR